MWNKIHFLFFFFFFPFLKRNFETNCELWWINLLRYRRRRRRAATRKSNETWKTRPTRKVMRSMFETSSLGPSTFFFAKQVPTVVILFMSLVLGGMLFENRSVVRCYFKNYFFFSLFLFPRFHKYLIFQRRNGESKA